MLDIAKMLRKKKWTGADIGRLEIANGALSYKDATENKMPEGEFPVPIETLQKMLDTITDPEQMAVYSGYVTIHKWITETMYKAKAELQQFNFRYYKYAMSISSALTAEEILACTAKLPESKELEDTVKQFQEIADESSLNRFFPGAEHAQFLTQSAVSDRSLIQSSLYFLYGFNKLLDIVADTYKLEEVQFFKVETDGLEKLIETLNTAIYTLHTQVAKGEYNTKELQKMKLGIVENLFKPIDVKSLEVPKKRIAQAKKDAKTFQGFIVGGKDLLETMNMYYFNPLKDIKEAPIDWERPFKEESTGG